MDAGRDTSKGVYDDAPRRYDCHMRCSSSTQYLGIPEKSHTHELKLVTSNESYAIQHEQQCFISCQCDALPLPVALPTYSDFPLPLLPCSRSTWQSSSASHAITVPSRFLMLASPSGVSLDGEHSGGT